MSRCRRRRPLFKKSENQPYIPYRSWCAHCVRGRGRNDPHRSRGARDHPHLSIDYGFLKANNPDDPADQVSNPILIGAEAKYGLTLAMAVPWEGKCCTMDCEACGGLVGLVGQSNGHFEV